MTRFVARAVRKRDRLADAESSRGAIRVKKRVETVKLFLAYVKRQLRPPSLILVRRAPTTYSLPVAAHA